MKIALKEGRDREALVQALRTTIDSGYAVVDTATLLGWAAANGGSRAINLGWARTHLDPDGLHVCLPMLFHNDREWRLRIEAKILHQAVATQLWQDVTPEQWDRAKVETRAALDALEGEES